MNSQNWRNNPRNLGGIGSACLAAGLIIFAVLIDIPGHMHNWAHGLAGFFIGLSLVFSIAALVKRRHNSVHSACGIDGNDDDGHPTHG